MQEFDKKFAALQAIKSNRHERNSTAVILFGLAISSVMLPSSSVSSIFTFAAYGVGIALVIATVMQGIGGLRCLIRVDILMLWALYGLTFFEFLFPQPDVDDLLSPAAATAGTYAVFVGFAGIVIGRHLVSNSPWPIQNLSQVGPRQVFALFLFASFLGYLPILVAVNFDAVEMLRQMALPRFSQAWGRGKFGDVYALFYEFQMLLYLIPPLAGVVFSRPKEFATTMKVVVLCILAVTLYSGFAAGTRGVLAVQVFTFAGAYFLTRPGLTFIRAFLLGVPIAGLLFVATTFMLEFRDKGLDNFSLAERHSHSVFVDRNIVIISILTQAFPDTYEFLGFEIPFNALIRPIPRALWPGKPEGLSTSIEDAVGARGMTISCTFVGEAYMSGGFIAVLVFSLLLGAGAAMWNRVSLAVGSTYTQLLYASGFLCAAVGMRSMLSMTTAMLPTLALWVYGRFLISSRLARSRHRTEP